MTLPVACGFEDDNRLALLNSFSFAWCAFFFSKHASLKEHFNFCIHCFNFSVHVFVFIHVIAGIIVI